MDPELIVRPDVPARYEQFGTSVALDGNLAIVGARNSTFNPGPGVAYIFLTSGSGVTQRARLTPSDSTGLDHFGAAVGIDGNYAVVGAPNAGSDSHGQAYIFAWDGSTWSEQALLTPGDGAPLGSFGVSVGINGNCAIVGANGAAYIFRRSGSNWIEEAMVTTPPPESSSGGGFGRAVSVHGDRAIVGNRWSGGTVQGQGAAYVFRADGTNWEHEATLAASDPVAQGAFGAAVAIDADYAIVGAPGATSDDHADAGGAYVFERIASAWQFRRKLEPSDSHAVNNFGESVAIRGDHVVVGDPAQHWPVAGTGAAYVYRRNGSNWNLLPPRIVAFDAGDEFDDMFAYFGQSVAVSPAGVLVGAPGNTDTEREQGAAYFYPLPAELSDVFRVAIDFAPFIDLLASLTSGGGIVRPGGPRPIDPPRVNDWKRLPSAKRDLIMGMGLSEIASFIDDTDARRRVKQAGQDLTRRAAARLSTTKKKIEQKS